MTSTTRAQEPTGFLNRAIEVEGVSHRYQVYVPAGYRRILQTSIGLGEGIRRHAERWQLWVYVRTRKKWWLPPTLIVMLLLGALLVFTQGSALAPFIYTIL
jgi:uncharacterized protein DUF5989